MIIITFSNNFRNVGSPNAKRRFHLDGTFWKKMLTGFKKHYFCKKNCWFSLSKRCLSSLPGLEHKTFWLQGWNQIWARSIVEASPILISIFQKVEEASPILISIFQKVEEASPISISTWLDSIFVKILSPSRYLTHIWLKHWPLCKFKNCIYKY